MYSYTYEMRYGDYKDYDTIKPSAILDIVQDVSTKDSTRCGYGIDKMREMNMAWLLQGTKVHFERPVSTKYPLDATTAVKKMKGAISERGCIIKQNGDVVAKTISNWYIFDGESKRPTRIPEEMSNSYKLHDFEDDFFTYNKPAILKIEEAEYSIRVSNKDIDTNKHLNNQKSAEILMDALPFDFYFNDMTLLYKRPAYLGEELMVCKKEIENGFYVHLETSEKEICVVGTFLNN